MADSKNRKLNLLNNREFLFKLYKFNTLFVYIYIVNYDIFEVFIKKILIVLLNYLVKLN